MNLADQIEAIARRATAQVVDASNTFSTTQQQLASELAELRAEKATPKAYLRTRLQRDADAADAATPRILLPADVAEASPHGSADDE